MRDQRVMAKDRDQQETLADLSPEESGWFSASLKHPEAKPEEVIEELREAIPIQMVPRSSGGNPDLIWPTPLAAFGTCFEHPKPFADNSSPIHVAFTRGNRVLFG